MRKSQTASNHNVSTFTFVVFVYFCIDFFLHFSQRIPVYGVIRPTIIIVLWLSYLLYLQRDKFEDVYITEPFKRIKWLIFYLGLSLFLVRWPGSALANLSNFVKAVCFFFFTAMSLDSEKRLKIFLTVFVGCQLFRVYEPLFLHITQGYWGSATHIGQGEFVGRLSGAPSDVINPNGLGFVIVTIVPFIYYLLWAGRFKMKLLFLMLLPPLLYALILTMSRGAFLSLLVVVWFMFKESKYKFRFVVVAIGISLTGLSVMTDLQKDRYLSLISSDTVGATTADGRLNGMVKEMILGLTTRPVFGNGLGTTRETKYHEWGKSQASHNLYAELIIEIGLLGEFFFLSYIFRLRSNLLMLGKLAQQKNVTFWRDLNSTLISVFWMYIVYSVNYFGLSQYYWYLFGGLVVAVARIYEKEVLCEK